MVYIPAEALKDRPHIAYVHIPKTGGTSFREYLRSQYRPCTDAVLNRAVEVAGFCALSSAEKLRFDLVSGHFPYGFDPQLPRRFLYFTCLREPVRRVVSNYNFMMSGVPQNTLAQRLRREKWTLRDFASTTDPEASTRLFAQLAYLGCSPTVEQPSTLRALFERAATNIVSQFAFVGCLELLDESVVYLHERFGFDLVLPPVENAAAAQHNRTASPDDIALIRERMQPETELYNLARRMLEERLATVEGLPDKVQQLRAGRENVGR